MNQNQIRNFCIIAHIDHGKSTLADRLLEITHTVAERAMKEQLLDQMDLERERGITIKLQPARMEYEINDVQYVLNLIDTPGHVDFSYEVSRSLAACEGALLVVDGSQGIEAQTLANAYLAIEHDLTLIPVINKIDLPNFDREKSVAEMEKVFGFKEEEILFASGKTGVGVVEILHEIVRRIPPPQGSESAPTRALIFDSFYDQHRGVVAYVRMIDGILKAREKIAMVASAAKAECLELGFLRPSLEPQQQLRTGEVGYIVTGLREVEKARVGDTITAAQNKDVIPLPGYRTVTPMVYAGLFPVSGDDYPLLRDAMEKLRLSDAALVFEPEHIPSIGFGFRTGFLGLLHMEIVQERLTREYNLDLVLTAPSVVYALTLTNNEQRTVYNPAQFPDRATILSIAEPWVGVTIVTPSQYIGAIIDLVISRRGINHGVEYVGSDRVEMKFEMPLATMISDLYDKLKSVTSGYASLNYEFREMRPGDLVKVDVLVGGEVVEPLASIMHRSEVATESRTLLARLKELIPRHQFEVALQAAVGGKVLCRETISALRKDVTGYLYGGDVTRKMKLLNKQKKGKKRMKQIGKVSIPQEAFLAVLKR